MSKWNSAILNRFTPLTFNKFHFQGHERTYACHRINAARKLKGILCWERIKDFQALPPAPFPKFLMGGGDMADLEGQGELAVTVVFIHTLCPASGSPSLKMQWLLKKKKKEYNYFLDLQSGHHRVSWLSSILSPLSSLAGVTPLFSLPSFLKAKFTFKHSDSFPGQLWHTIQGPVLKIFTKLSLQCHHRIWKLGISMTTRLLFKLTFLFLFPTASKQFNST